MNCNQAQEWLLQADSPRPAAWPAAIANHVEQCAACRSLIDDIVHLESTWRKRPTPPEADRSRLAFLESMPKIAAPRRRPRRPSFRWAAAAAILLCFGVGLWFLGTPPQAQAAPLVEQLVDWNLQMTQAETPAERTRLLASEPQLRAAFEKANLPEEDRELASELLENGRWLAENEDPVAQAERFSAVADQLVDHLQKSAARGDTDRARRFAQLQNLIADHGVAANFERAKASGALTPKLEKLALRDKKRAEALVELLEKSPDATRKEIRKALDLHHKNPRSNRNSQ
jgi:hypothetical protein